MKRVNYIIIISCSIFLTTLHFVIDSDSLGAQSNSSEGIGCGEYVNKDIKLSFNLYCDSNGLIVENQTGLAIDLNGYNITGPGVESKMSGIVIEGSKNVRITGKGTINNFQAGILNKGDNNSISNTVLAENEIGIFISDTSSSVIYGNHLMKNIIGLASHSSNGLRIVSNFMDSNQMAGISFVKSNENQITSNTLKGSINGIFLDSQSSNNIIGHNTATNNSNADLNNGHGLPPGKNNNSFDKNTCKKSVPYGICEKGPKDYFNQQSKHHSIKMTKQLELTDIGSNHPNKKKLQFVIGIQ